MHCIPRGPGIGIPHIHIEDQGERPGLLLVDVNNGGQHARPSSDLRHENNRYYDTAR